ncbi:inorganic phosphate transporter [Rothia uropygioeca]|uniref:inorganic phosphate transporter n=1 Tax=Kocuria sp. 257 TaxID=2021970 RepID=UPI0010112B89|nr:inorganic phosphate transporter [Kocuria sp. 257]
MEYFLFALCGLFLLGYTVIGCFHDASNAVAVPVGARALTPKVALIVCAFFNVVGLLIGSLTLSLTSDHWLTIPHDDIGLAVLTSSLLTVILWEIFTWWRRSPSSSTNALIGGVFGALWATQQVGLGDHLDLGVKMVGDVVLPLILAPLAAFGIAWVAVIPLVHLLQHTSPGRIHRRSRYVLSLSTSVISLGHGIYFGHRSLVIGALMWMSIGHSITSTQTAWMCTLIGVMMVIGTLMGSWRIGHTISDRLVTIDPFRGAVAQAVTSLLVFGTGAVAKDPFSSSHLAASAVLGAGSNQRFHAVRAHTAARLVLTWIVTVPVTVIVSAIFFLALSPLL